MARNVKAVAVQRLGVLLLLLGIFSLNTFGQETIRIASYNLKNYLIMDRLVEGQWRKDYPKPEAEKSIIQKNILEVRPDILVIQEIGGKGILNELKEDLKELGLDYSYSLLMKGEDPVRLTAVLSQLKPRYVKEHDDLRYRYFDQKHIVKRGMHEVGFMHEIPFTIFSVHLKSRYTSDKRDPLSAKWRLSEAESCRNRIIERLDQTGMEYYIIAGDFNDNPNSAPLRRFYKKGKRSIGEHLMAKNSRGESWTHFYNKEKVYSMVDGFVLSPSLMPFVKGGLASILDSEDFYQGSDHRLIYFDLMTSK